MAFNLYFSKNLLLNGKVSLFIYLFTYLAALHSLQSLSCLTRIELCYLNWKHGVLTTGLPGKFLKLYVDI